jgi:uncharacterized membrane protein
MEIGMKNFSGSQACANAVSFCGLLICCLSVLLGGIASAQTGFVSFDIPGAAGIEPSSINSSGTVAGTYLDDNINSHGFLRTSDGTIVVVNVPGFTNTSAACINNNEQIVGYSMNGGAPVFTHGFLRSRLGSFTRIDVPNELNTEPTWISNSGLIVGYVFGDGGSPTAFLRDLNGVYTFIDPPDAAHGSVSSAVNDNGQVVGTYVDSSFNQHEFFRDSDGTITEFDPPSGTYPVVVNPRINSAGTIVSVYATPQGNLESFLRDSSGDFTILNMPGEASTLAEDLNDLGEVVGFAEPSLQSSFGIAFRRNTSGDYSNIPVPAGTLSAGAGAVNTNGRITGSYFDASDVQHGFVF